jgi:hypothetical protein
MRWLDWLFGPGIHRTLDIVVLGFMNGFTGIESVSSMFLFSVRDAT